MQDDIATTLGYREEGNTWFLYRIQRFKDYHQEWLKEVGLQLYAPKNSLGYHFVLGTTEQVDALYNLRQIGPLRTRPGEYKGMRTHEKTFQTVGSKDMRSLMIILENRCEEVEFCTPEQHLLEKGDRVRVVTGEFKGVEGILLQNQGARDGGRVYVSLGDDIGVATAKVPDECIQVLEFAKGTNHFYYKHQAIEQLLTEALATHKYEGKINSYQQVALDYFMFRYEYLSNLTFLNLARWVACKYAALRLLSQRDKAEAALADYYQWRKTNKKARRSSLRTPAAQEYIDQWVKRVADIE